MVCGGFTKCPLRASMCRKALHLRIGNLLPRGRNTSSTPKTFLLLCAPNDECKPLVNILGKLLFSLNLRFLPSSKICRHQVFTGTWLLSEYSHRMVLKVLSLYFGIYVLKLL